MSNSPFVQYWDSCVIIHRIQRTAKYIGDLEQMTNDAENGKLQIVLSTFTLAEVFKDPDGGVDSKEEDRKIVELFENPYFAVRPLTLPIAILARQISREHGIKPKDAVHIATAVYWEVPIFVTTDNDLIGKSGLVGNPPLLIEAPKWRGQQALIPAPQLPDSTQDMGQLAESGELENTAPVESANAESAESQLPQSAEFEDLQTAVEASVENIDGSDNETTVTSSVAESGQGVEPETEISQS